MVLFYKKTQSAMEFIMTYGWALLVVLIVILALVYFGILNPQMLLPERAELKQGLDIVDVAVDENSITYILRNNLGRDVLDLIINATECNNGEGALSIPLDIAAGKTKKIQVYCDHSIEVGERMKSRLSAKWRTRNSDKGKGFEFDHATTGSIQITVTRGKTLEDRVRIVGCNELNLSNTIYYLNSDIEDNDLTDDCIRITAKHITLDCNGYYIKSDDPYTGIYSTQNNTVIKGCNITMASGINEAGIELSNANDSSISNTTVSGTYFGIFLNSSSHCNITNNTIKSSTDDGVVLRINAGYNTISNNIISENNDGVHIDTYSSDNVVIDNVIIDNKDEGVEIDDYSSFNKIIGNIIDANGFVGAEGHGIQIEDYSTNNEVENNTITNNQKDGVHIKMYSDDNLIKNNTIMGNIDGDGIHIEDFSTNMELIDNTIRDNNQDGIKLRNTNGNRIQGNIVCDHGAVNDDFDCESSSGTFGSENQFTYIKKCTTWPVHGVNYIACN